MNDKLKQFLEFVSENKKIKSDLDQLLFKNFDTKKSFERIQNYAKSKGFDLTIEEIQQLDDTPEDFTEKQRAFVESLNHDYEYPKFLQMSIDYETLRNTIKDFSKTNNLDLETDLIDEESLREFKHILVRGKIKDGQ